MAARARGAGRGPGERAERREVRAAGRRARGVPVGRVPVPRACPGHWPPALSSRGGDHGGRKRREGVQGGGSAGPGRG